jgi:thymidylate synthase
MKQYHVLLEDILAYGNDVSDRTGVGTRSIFGYQMRFDLNEGFPAVTTKKLAWKSVVGELLWFLEGSTDERRLAELTYGKNREELVGKTTIWTANADKQGVDLGHYNDDYIKDLGPVYGAQWRNFSYFNGDPSGKDQIINAINEIKRNPDSRRIIVSAWNPILLDSMSLPPCHILAHFRVYDGKLNCLMYQRSADAGIGVPFNIASYSLLTHIIARECNLQVGEFVHFIGDAHIYNNHIDQVKKQLQREPFTLPTLEIDDSFNLFSVVGNRGQFSLDTVNKFKLINYRHHSTIKMDMAV